MVPVKNLGELTWCSGCFYARAWENVALMTSQQTFAEQLPDEYGIEFGKSVPLPFGARLAEFDKNQASGDWPFCELVGSLIRVSTQTPPDVSYAVRAVARYCSPPKIVHWTEALVILGYVMRIVHSGLLFRDAQ